MVNVGEHFIHGAYGIVNLGVKKCIICGHVPCVHDFFNVFFKHTSLSAHSEPIAKHPRLTFVIHKSYLQLGTFLRTNQLGSIGRKVCYTYFDVYGIKVHPGTRNDQFKMDVW